MFDLGLTFCNSDFDLIPAKTCYGSTLLHLRHFRGSKGVFEDMRSMTLSYWQLLLFKDKNYEVIDKTYGIGVKPYCVSTFGGLWVHLG